MTEEKNVHPWKKNSKEDMEWEIDRLSLYDEGEEFPKEETAKVLQQLNVTGIKSEMHHDNARSAPQ